MNSNRNGMLVSSSEAERFTLHQTLRSLMPEAVADTLMSHLPPAGWSDVARKSDIEDLRVATKHDIEELRVATKHDIQELRVATKHDIDALRDATKHDIDALRDASKHDIDALRVATKHDIDALRDATKHDIDALRDATKHDIDALRDATKHDIDLLAVRLDNVQTRLESIEGKLGDLASMKRYVVTTGIALATLISGFGVPLLLAVT